jgi:hypothetical protein
MRRARLVAFRYEAISCMFDELASCRHQGHQIMMSCDLTNWTLFSAMVLSALDR